MTKETVNLNMSLLAYATKIAEGRTTQKKNYKSSNPLSPNYELVGVLGELVYSYTTNELMDGVLKVQGDDGFDFSKRVQVKSSEKYKAKHLIEYIDKNFTKFDYYVFVVIDLFNLKGEIIGWISTQDFMAKAQIIDFGYGERYAVLLSELNPWGPV